MDIQKELEEIQKRNAQVTIEKSWETSVFRRICIAIIIYAASWITLALTGDQQSALHSIVPPIAYYISTLSLPYLKKYWIKKRRA